MSVYIHKIKHKLWESYTFNPPIKYSHFRFLTNTAQSFNKNFKNKKNKIIEVEQILLMTGDSLNYEFMLSKRFDLIARLTKPDIKYLISPTDIAKKNAL